MASYCAKGGHVVKKAWVPLGTKDYSSVISGIPARYRRAGRGAGRRRCGELPHPVRAGRRRQADDRRLDHRRPDGAELQGQEAANRCSARPSAGPMADRHRHAGMEEVRRRLQGQLPGRLPQPVAVRLSSTTSTPRRCCSGSTRSRAISPTTSQGSSAAPCQARVRRSRRHIKLDENRNAIGDTYITEVAKAPDGDFYNKVVKVVHDVSQTLGLREGRVQQDGSRQPRRAELPVSDGACATSLARRSHGVGDALAAGAKPLASGDALVLEGVSRAFGALRPSRTSRSRSRPASAAPCSAPTAPARRRCSTPSPATSRRPRDASASSART